MYTEIIDQMNEQRNIKIIRQLKSEQDINKYGWVNNGRQETSGGWEAGRAGNISPPLSQVTGASRPAAQCVLSKDSAGGFLCNVQESVCRPASVCLVSSE